jgi:hypothetical protein
LRSHKVPDSILQMRTKRFLLPWILHNWLLAIRFELRNSAPHKRI